MALSAADQARRRLALNARAARERLGLTQERASEVIDCSVQALRRIEGAKAVVTLDFVAKIAAAYRVDPAELLQDAGAWIPPKPGRPVLAGRKNRRSKQKTHRRT